MGNFINPNVDAVLVILCSVLFTYVLYEITRSYVARLAARKVANGEELLMSKNWFDMHNASRTGRIVSLSTFLYGLIVMVMGIGVTNVREGKVVRSIRTTPFMSTNILSRNLVDKLDWQLFKAESWLRSKIGNYDPYDAKVMRFKPVLEEAQTDRPGMVRSVDTTDRECYGDTQTEVERYIGSEISLGILENNVSLQNSNWAVKVRIGKDSAIVEGSGQVTAVKQVSRKHCVVFDLNDGEFDATDAITIKSKSRNCVTQVLRAVAFARPNDRPDLVDIITSEVYQTNSGASHISTSRNVYTKPEDIVTEAVKYITTGAFSISASSKYALITVVAGVIIIVLRGLAEMEPYRVNPIDIGECRYVFGLVRSHYAKEGIGNNPIREFKVGMVRSESDESLHIMANTLDENVIYVQDTGLTKIT